MHADPILAYAVAAILITLLISLLMKQLRQSHVVACLLAGIVLGPHVTGLFTQQDSISRFGSLGVVLLMFFVGMEVSPQRLVKNWKIATLGTTAQVTISVLLVWILGYALEWTLARIILLGFVISLSSTAVVLKLLQDWNELNTDTGQDVLGVLLMQDLFIVPMLIILNLFSGNTPDTAEILMQVCGGIGLISLVVFITVKNQIQLPFLKHIVLDHETQVFTALAICFGFGLITAVLGLSTALGAFVAGMLVASSRETDWVRHALEPFRVIFIALFFVSIGMLMDLNFVLAHSWQVTLLVLAVFITNTFINAGTFRAFGESWRKSIYAGALLSQIGEFSFVLAAAGFHAAIITSMGYQYAISVILFSLIFSPAWIALMRRLTRG